MGKIVDQVEQPISAQKIDKISEKFERQPRKVIGKWFVVISIIAIAMSLFHLFTAGIGSLEAMRQRATHLTFAMVLAFLLYPANRKSNKIKPTTFDIILAVLSLVSIGYMAVFSEDLAIRGFYLLPRDYLIGIVGTILVFEAARRTVGWELVAVGLAFLAYTFFGQYIPGTFGHTGFPWTRIINHMYLTTEGLFGTAIGVSANYIILFIIFGSFLNASGMGKLFNDLAFALTGHLAGGPAKVAVIGSSLMGTINGSAIANATTTGAFTIPLMKKVGYPATFAAATEAVASTGGQIVPPVMGAAAFVMAEMVGLPYIQVCIAAILPAFLYYLGCYTAIHLRARKLGLLGLPKEQLPDPYQALKERGHLIIPIIVLVYLLIKGLSPTYAAFWSTILLIAISFIRTETRMNLEQISSALRQGAIQGVSIAVACGLIGYIIGTVSLTAIGVVLTKNIVAFSQGLMLPTLLMTMVAAIILGMGLPTTAVYIVAGAICSPALREVGIPVLPAHFFILYFGILSTITPPVAMTAYAAAGLADANPSKAGWRAFAMGLPGFIVPFVFVYEPALLILNANFLTTIRVFFTASIGVTALSTAVEGYFYSPMNIFERIGVLIGALCMISPDYMTDICGVLLLGAILVFHKKRSQKFLSKQNEVSVSS